MNALSVAVMLVALVAAPGLAETERVQFTNAIARAEQDQQTSPSSSTPGDTPAVPQRQPPKSGDDDEHGDDTSPQTKSGDHMFGVLPNYTTVENGGVITPVGARQKFKMASLNTFDPYVYPFVGFVAALNRTYGSGVSGYLKQYAASLTDNTVGNFLTTAVLPSVLHQDPRYFVRGSGGGLNRAAYAATRIVVTRSDAGHLQFNVSEIGGNAIAATVSNTYYPSTDRTAAGTLSRWGMQLMWDTLSNELKEFWPDIRQKLHRQ